MSVFRSSRIRALILLFAGVLALGTVIFWMLEPFTWVQAFYFTVATVTTVGYGDLVPSSDWTRLVVAIYALFAITFYLAFASFLGIHFLEREEEG